MTYTIIGIQPIQFSVEENEFNYGGFVAIDGAKCSACYHEPAFGIPYLTLLYKRSDYDSWDETPELNVVLRIGYPPTFHKGKKIYGDFLEKNGDKIVGEFARVAHSKDSHNLVPICENLARNLKLYLKTGNYKVIWNPQEMTFPEGTTYVDGSIAIGLDAQLKNPKMVLYYNMIEIREIPDIFLVGTMPLLNEDIRKYSIETPEISRILGLDDDMLSKLNHVVYSKGIPAREVYEAKRMAKGLSREPWSDI